MVSNLEYVISTSEEIEEILIESVKDYFLLDVYQDTSFESAIGEYLDAFRDDLYFVVEYPYVDKVYRNSYYSYYASKHAAYQRDCIRISVFSDEVTPEDFSDIENHASLRNRFLGYFILRPIKAIFGRSVIHPSAFEENVFQICSHKADCLVFGIKMTVEGFPHSSQDGETISCAETTIWALMEYFGTRYPDYKPVLPSAINKTLEILAMERQLPTKGLTMNQISFALKQFGFGTRIYSKPDYGADVFEIIDTYIESGIPVMTGLESVSGEIGHVVVLIGKKYEAIDYTGITPRSFTGFGRDISYFDTAQFSDFYVVQDDNLPPYRLITLAEPGSHYDEQEEKDYVIDTIVVPLYPKIYLEAFVAKSLILEILKDQTLGFDFADGFVLRFFLASSRSFKSHISGLGEMDIGLRNTILLAKMPKFIWVAEIYDQGSFQPNTAEATGLIVLDATEANNISSDTLIFAGYPDRFVSIDQNKFIFLQHILKNYSYYSNLK